MIFLDLRPRHTNIHCGASDERNGWSNERITHPYPGATEIYGNRVLADRLSRQHRRIGQSYWQINILYVSEFTRVSLANSTRLIFPQDPYTFLAGLHGKASMCLNKWMCCVLFKIIKLFCPQTNGFYLIFFKHFIYCLSIKEPYENHIVHWLIVTVLRSCGMIDSLIYGETWEFHFFGYNFFKYFLSTFLLKKI